ncbi:MAG: protein kinase [Planctomycetes bacterium]|nr:protein kinase [Planctomycetota bacterium]
MGAATETQVRSPHDDDASGADRAASRAPTEPDAAAPTPPDAPVAGGTFGRYVLRKELGRGGVGVVYEAWDPQLGRQVALKTLLAGRGASDVQLLRFVREARAAAHLRHPNIVSIHDAGTIDERPYLTMDAIDGQPLDRLVAEGGAPAPRQVVELLVPIARALEFAHAQGIVHRDVKPENILVDHAGHPYLTDFGLARDLALPRLTKSEATVGTPAFMAPEQLRGGAPEPRMDIYALGATLYECLTGRVPFSGDSFPELVRCVLQDEPAAPRRLNPRIAPDLEAIVLQCLEKDPARRYASAGRLADDLARFLAGEAVHARPPSAVRRAARRVLRHRALVTGGVVALAGLLGGAGVALWVRREAEAEARVRAKLEEERARLLEGRRLAEARATREEERRAALVGAALATTLEGQVAAYDPVVEAWPDAWDVLIARARALRALCQERRARGHDLAAARDAAARALADLEAAADATQEGAGAWPVLFLQAELLRLDLKDAARARAALTRLTAAPGALGHYARARLLLAAGDAEAAHPEASAALEARPDLDPARVLLAEVLLARGHAEAAVSQVDRAAAGPSGGEAVRVLGVALLRLGDAVAAQQQALRAVELDPEDAAAHLLLGRARLALGEPVRALAALDRAHALRPLDPEPLRAAAETARLGGDVARAEALEERAALLAAPPVR